MYKITTPKSPHPFAANTYIISSGGEVAIIDPTVPYDSSLFVGRVKYVFLTHVHFDHMLELKGWMDNTDAELIVSHQGISALSDSERNCYMFFLGKNTGYYGKASPTRENDVFSLGDEKIKIIECPGHTDCSITLLINDAAIVGDTIFAGGGFGRWDLPTGNLNKLRASIKRLSSLPEETLIYSGHGEPTTVKEYKSDFRYL